MEKAKRHLGILTTDEYNELTPLEQAERKVYEMTRQHENLKDHFKSQDEKIASLREIISAVNDKNDGHYYSWMPHEENRLETLSAPVLIPADWLRQLIKEGYDKGVKEARAYTSKVITLCGSTKFRKQLEDINAKLTLEGNTVISVGVYAHDSGVVITEEQKENLDRIHLQKIDMADEIFVVNVGGYIGSSTLNEIAYANRTGKPVRYLENHWALSNAQRRDIGEIRLINGEYRIFFVSGQPNSTNFDRAHDTFHAATNEVSNKVGYATEWKAVR